MLQHLNVTASRHAQTSYEDPGENGSSPSLPCRTRRQNWDECSNETSKNWDPRSQQVWHDKHPSLFKSRTRYRHKFLAFHRQLWRHLMTKIFSSGTVNNRQSNKQIKPGVLLFSTNSPSKNLRFFAEIFVEFFVALNKTKRFFIFTFSQLKSEREYFLTHSHSAFMTCKTWGKPPLKNTEKKTGQIKTLENTQPDSAFK